MYQNHKVTTTVNGIIYGTVPNTIEALNIKEVRNVSMNPQLRRKMNVFPLNLKNQNLSPCSALPARRNSV